MAPRILLVEDDRAIRLTIEHFLITRGYTVVAATNAADAVRANDACPFDVVILDVNLPDGTGWDVARHIRGAGGGSVRIVMISAMPPRAALVRATGVAGVLLKPFPMDSLLRLIDQLVREEPRPLDAASGSALAAAVGANDPEAPASPAVKRGITSEPQGG